LLTVVADASHAGVSDDVARSQTQLCSSASSSSTTATLAC